MWWAVSASLANQASSSLRDVKKSGDDDDADQYQRSAEHGSTSEDLKVELEENRKAFNQAVASYEQLAAIEVVDQEFEKTPKKNIKRFLYS